MARNKVAPEQPVTKKDNFFQNKSQTKFKAKHKNAEKSQTKTSASASGSSQVAEVKQKKPFDKKTWRLQKYSKKYKLEQWEDKRKQAVLRGYYRNLKHDEPKLDVQKIYQEAGDDDEAVEENENNLNTNLTREAEVERSEIPRSSKERKSKGFKKAHLEFQRIKEEKLQRKEDAQKKKTERAEALEKYKKKKMEKFKKLSRKTRKGQPVMKDRIEMMLEKIQSTMM